LAWLIDAVTVMAENFGKPFTVQRLEIYARDLAALPPDPLSSALLRARHELRFFPKVAELCELAGQQSPKSVKWLKLKLRSNWSFGIWNARA